MLRVLVCAMGSIFPALTEPPPEPLRRMLEHRLGSFTTAHVEWEEQTERHRRSLTSRYAPGQHLVVDHGDETGCTDPEGRRLGDASGATLGWVYSEHRVLFDSGRQWSYKEDGFSAVLFDEFTSLATPQPDLRTLGLFPRLPQYYSKQDMYPERLLDDQLSPDSTYSTRELPDGLVEVSARLGEGETRWLLDPAKGWQPRRVENSTVLSDGRLRHSMSETTYRQYDGGWFVDAIEFSDNEGGFARVAVSWAEFDAPHLPGSLDLCDATGMVPGVNMTQFSAGDADLGPRVFDGKDAVSVQDAVKRKADGTWPDCGEFGRLLKVTDEGYIPGGRPKKSWTPDDIAPELGRTPGLWEDYTRRFIAFYRLEPAQVDRAWRVLALHQPKAYSYLEEKKPDLRKYEAERDEARRQTADEKIDVEPLNSAKHRLRAAEQAIDRLLEPVDRMFKEKFRPDLLKLPTKAQHEDAASRRAAVQRPAK